MNNSTHEHDSSPLGSRESADALIEDIDQGMQRLESASESLILAVKKRLDEKKEKNNG